MKLLILGILGILVLSGCVENRSQENQTNECLSNSDCIPAGCSNQICVSKNKASDIVTTCEWKEQYSCLQKTSCGCVQNKCEWDYSEPEYRSCIDNLPATQEEVY